MSKTALLTLSVFLFGLFSVGTATGGDLRTKGVTGSDHHGMVHGQVGVLHSAEDFIGTEVRDSAGQEIGEVKDVKIDFQRGIGYAEISSEEALAVDETFLVPLTALTATHEGEFVTLNVDRSRISAAPRMEPGMSSDEYGRNLHDHYGLSYPWSDLPGQEPIRPEDKPAENLTYPGPRGEGSQVPAR
ncbi:MAG: PRC-barrel domain-containing protein [Desulfuromonadales bacterium]|nr:PRC-barrel domain-containing protein [Desulfuromonadales bacterium]